MHQVKKNCREKPLIKSSGGKKLQKNPDAVIVHMN
jgi:hypothetical protein